MSRAREVARRAAVVAGALTSRVAARFGDGVAVATDEHAGRWRCVARRGGEVVAVASGYAAEGEALRALAERMAEKRRL